VCSSDLWSGNLRHRCLLLFDDSHFGKVGDKTLISSESI